MPTLSGSTLGGKADIHNEEASTTTVRMYGAVAEELIVAHRGHIFSSVGDGFVAEFPNAVEAFRCAVESQNEIAEHNAADQSPTKEQL